MHAVLARDFAGTPFEIEFFEDYPSETYGYVVSWRAGPAEDKVEAALFSCLPESSSGDRVIAGRDHRAPIYCHRTPEKVIADMDRAGAELGAKARAILQAEGATTIPLRMGLFQALAILAPRGDELAQVMLAVLLGFDPLEGKTYPENLPLRRPTA
jgi:hypothetical protein